jgi:hypothetical protein
MWKSPRVEMYDEGEADEARQLELDSVEEARCNALVQSTRYLSRSHTLPQLQCPREVVQHW